MKLLNMRVVVFCVDVLHRVNSSIILLLLLLLQGVFTRLLKM